MQIVIDMPEEMWERVKEGYVPLGISKHLRNGTPLPKGHGRIIDESKITLPFFESEVDEKWVKIGIKNAPTIIEADRDVEA